MKIGDKVVCIDRKSWRNIQVGNIYNATAVSTCRCGQVMVSILEFTGGEVCSTCYNDCPSNGKGWFVSSCFRKVDYTYGTEVCEAIETEFTKLKEPVTI